MCTNQQVSIMCDIARTGGIDLRAEHFSDVLDLIALNCVEADDGSETRFKLTTEGQALLDERGVGLNES